MSSSQQSHQKAHTSRHPSSSPSHQEHQEHQVQELELEQDITPSSSHLDHEVEEPTTPRAIPRQRHLVSSGSETEREASHRKGKRIKSKGKDKDRRVSSSSSTQQPASSSSSSSSTTTSDSMLSTRSGKSSSSSSSRKHGSSAGKAKKSDDWSEVTDPEERRRIQNRIAQRKFREKAREQKERDERESRNLEHAASSYQVPVAEDLGIDEQLSGVPWGGPSFRFMVAKGHESMSSGSRHSHSGAGSGSYRGGSSSSGTGGDLYGSVSVSGSGSGSGSGSSTTPDYLFDDPATAIYAHGSSHVTAATMGMMPAAAGLSSAVGTATTDAYYYPSHEDAIPYAYGSGDSSRSSSDYTQAAASQEEQFYDDGSFYYDYES